MATEKPRWVEAGGEYQIPFLLAARRVLQGEPVPCSKCGARQLRFYFHVMNPQRGSGTLWVWCPNCRTKCHLPRIAPTNVPQNDPFANLSLDQFAELELDPREPLMDRLDRLWNEGKLSPLPEGT